ncbi:MAG TPA: hypothetical protein VM512_09655, partial [Burkholderiaceae bacterium]|nr:hypothetical protein [Burkholderiaceae bacterium]
MTNITRGSSAIHLTGGIETVHEQASTGNEPAKLSFLARTRRGFSEHFRYVFSSKAEQTLQWGTGASSTANADSNGANGDTTSANVNQAYTWTGGPNKYADKNKATGNSPHGQKRAESGKGMNRLVGDVLDQPSVKTRLATRLKKLSRSAVKSIARNFPRRGRAGAVPNFAPGTTSTNAGHPESSDRANDKHPSSAEFLPTRDAKDFAARLRELFPGLKFEPTNWTSTGADKTRLPEKIDPHNASIDGPFRPGSLQMQHERDLAELSTRLDKFKGLMPGCGYLYALKISEALAEGCHGDARLAIHVLDEMERIRVSSRADSATQHDPLKAALGCMSRLGPWLEHTKPKLFVSHETKDESGYCQPKKIFRSVECDQAFSRTAALLSDTHHTHHGFDAFCLATGMMSPHALRASRKKEDACGSAGPHQLDLTQPDIGKRLVLTCLQALQQDDGKASGNQLATRVIGHTRKIAEMLKNKQLMKNLPKTPEHAAFLAPNFKDINDPSRIEQLRQRQKLEKEALKQRIDMLIYGNEKIGLTGIGESAFVDLQCWFNDMHTEEEVDRLGRMLKEFAVDYQVCEALAERPILAKFGPLQQLVEGSSPLYARYKVGGGAVSKRHPDEDHKEAVDTVKQILDEMLGDITRATEYANANNAVAAARNEVAYTELQDPGKTDRRLLALQVGHMLLAAGCELDSKAPEQKKRDEITKAIAKLTNHLGGAAEEAVQEAISAYCAIFAPELEGNQQPATFVDLFLQQNLCNTKLSHTRREQLVQQLATLIDYPGVSPNTLAGLCGKMEKLAILNDGNLARGPATMENVCKHRQFRHLFAQDNTETNTHGISGTITAGADIPLTPDGQLKLSPSIQISRGGNKTMLTANENNVTQMVIGKEASLSGKLTVGLGYTEKFGIGAADCEATAGGEASAAAERSMLVGGQISIKRHALNFVEEGNILETELARTNYEGVGEFGEFRVIGTRIEKLHKRMACNPDNLPQEQLPLLYPEHLRPHVKLSKEDQEVRPFSGKAYTDEERKALRDPMRQSKLADMSGDKYFRQFFIEFRHDAHLIAVSECHREIVSLKATGSVGAKSKASVAGVGKAEAKADLISHTYAQEVNNRRDVKGSLLFQYIMLNTTRATTMGASAELTTGKGVVSDDESMAGRLAYKRRLGWTLERSLIKWISKEGETDDFYSYEGRNYSSYAALKQDVMKDRQGWGVLLREAPLPRPQNVTDDEYAELQKLADQRNLDAKLASLEAIEGHQNMQYLIRFRMRKSTAVKLDQLRCEIHHTEATLCETVDRLSRLKPDSPLRNELKAKLSRLEHTLDKLYTEKNDLLTNPQSWSPFGLGA